MILKDPSPPPADHQQNLPIEAPIEQNQNHVANVLNPGPNPIELNEG